MSDWGIVGNLEMKVPYFLAIHEVKNACFGRGDTAVLSWSMGQNLFVTAVIRFEDPVQGDFQFTIESMDGKERAAVRFPNGKIIKYQRPAVEGEPWVEDE